MTEGNTFSIGRPEEERPKQTGWIKLSEEEPPESCDVNSLVLWSPSGAFGNLVLGTYRKADLTGPYFSCSVEGPGFTFSFDLEIDDVSHWQHAPYMGPDHG